MPSTTDQTPDAVRAAIATCRRDVAEALTMATRAGVGFEQGMIEARRLAADADRKVADAFATLTDLLANGADDGGAGEQQ